jgi:adenosine kinase
MLKHIHECHDRRVPLVFDPGQQITAFSSQEIMQCLGQSQFLIANDYEIKLIEKKTGWDTKELLKHTPTIIMTLGERGSVVMTNDQKIEIPPAKPKSFDDPTGAGDAYRAGFFTAYTLGYDWKTCGQAGAVAACYAIEHYGTQNHSFTTEEFEKRYREEFGQTISLKQ